MSPSAYGSLAAFEDAFAAALDAEAPSLAEDMAEIVAQPGFAVYRNGVMKHAIDALQANFPAVARWAGEPWFRAAASDFARTTPPRTPMLLEYGEGFPDFLQHFEPAAEIPYIADIARLDRMWTEAHIAPDAAVLDPGGLAHLCPEALYHTVLHVHPSARWAWFGGGPVFTIWSRSRDEAYELATLDDEPEGALIIRANERVSSCLLDAGECAFLDGCAAAVTLPHAAHAALAAAPDTDLERLMCRLLESGAFSTMSFRSAPAPEI